jgi:DNA polymerase III sliding clamp (beta) subunit (PCNA family)
MNREIGGEARDAIPITYDGEEHLIGFNAQYFAEIISMADTAKVRLEMNTQISACLVFPEAEKKEDEHSSDVFLIMPLRIMDEV